MRRELLRLEEEVPWDAVKGTWKARRKAWCRTVRSVRLPSGFCAVGNQDECCACLIVCDLGLSRAIEIDYVA